VEFRVLGPLQVAENGHLLELGAAKERTLLAVLLLHANETVSTERLIDELWGERPPASAAKLVATYVWQLRKVLGGVIVTRSPGYVAVVPPEQLDVGRFELLVAQAQREQPAEAAATLREALELWRGTALEDVAFASSAREDVARLEDQRLSAVAQRIDHDLALGRHESVLAELQALVAAHPYRERYRAQLMLALYRSGRQSDALETYREARRRFVDELGIEPGPELQRLERSILDQDPALDLPATATPPGADLPDRRTRSLRNPYKGLRPFEEADAPDFFGREALTEQLVARLAETRFLVVVGPSGSGKSSVVRAGLIPALRNGALPGSERWHVVELFPGAYPLEELEAALLRIAVNPPTSLLEQLEADERGLLRAVKRVLPGDGSELVLVVDQLEEVFTLVADEQRRTRLLALLEAAVRDPHARLRVVATLRADFYDRPLLYRGFAELMRDHVEAVVPLAPEEFERAISAPAERVDLTLEPGLVSEMVADVANAPGALPLLQYTLTELFEQREGRVLTHASYRAIGGVSGALAGRADELYSGLDQVGKQAARQLFLRLVTLGEGAEDARRRVERTELASLDVDQAAMAAAIDAFGSSRLLSFDRDPRTGSPTVEVAHEVLLRAWARLRGWIDAAREDVRLHRRLSAAAAEWAESGRDPSFLPRGNKLDQHASSAGTGGLALTDVERDFLAAGLEQKLTEERAERERVEQTLRQNRRLRVAVGIIAVALAATIVAGLAAFRAQDREAEARSVAEAGRLGALALLEDELDRSLLLAREGVALHDSLETRSNLLAALLRGPAAIGITRLNGDAVRWLDLTADGRVLAASFADGKVILLDVRRRKQVGSPIRAAAVESGLLNVEFSPDRSLLAASSLFGRVGLWDTRTQALRHRLQRPEGLVCATVAFSPNGQTVAGLFVEEAAFFEPVPGRAVIVRWDASTGRRVGSPVQVSSRGGDFMHYTSDGERLVVVNHAAVTVVDARTLRRVATLPHGGRPRFFSIAVSPRDPQLAALLSVREGTVEFLDLATGKRRRAVGERHTEEAERIRFSPDGTTLATSAADGKVVVWDVKSGRALETFRGHTGDVEGLAFSPDSRTLYSGARSSIIAWDLHGSRSLGRPFPVSPSGISFPHPRQLLVSFAVSPDGSKIAVPNGDRSHRVALFDFATLKRLGPSFSPGLGRISALRFSPDGRTLAVGGEADAAALLDAGSGELVRRLSDAHAGGVASIRFSPDGRKLVTSGIEDGRAIVWEEVSGRRIRVLDEPGGSLVFVDWSPDGSMLATGGSRIGFPDLGDGRVVLWSTADWSKLATLEADSALAPSIDFSPDGATIAAGGNDGIARLWDTETARPVGRPLVHPGWVDSLEFDPTGEILVTSSQDGNVRLWDAESQRQIGSVLPGSGIGNRAAFTPDGKRVVVAYGTGVGLVWNVDPERWKARACAVAGRSLTPDEWAEFVPDRAYEPSCG
jgi:WD40 repeat protein/DNA-binding SARP family transcriptional activator